MKLAGMATVLSLSLIACSSENKSYSPDEVIENALAETTELTSYYAESILTSNDGTGTIEMKEWTAKDGKKRVESKMKDTGDTTISVNNGKQILTYEEATNTAYTFDISKEDNLQKSPKEQAQLLLNMVKDTHTITVKGEEKLIGRDAYHIKAEPKDEKSLYGTVEVWVDKETRFILKTISTSDDLKMTSEYTKLDLEPKIDDKLFTLKLPDDVKMTDIGAMAKEEEVASLEEAVTLIGKEFLVVKEQDGLVIEQMTVIPGIEDRQELTLNYYKEGLPYFSLSVFAMDEANKPFTGEGVEIRGLQGEKMDMDGFRLLNWAEDGLGYSVILTHPDLTFEEMQGMIEEMESVQ